MDMEGPEIIQLELKYCERCGGLWLRQRDSGEAYCPPCAVAMREIFPSSRKPGRPRLPIHERPQTRTQVAGGTWVLSKGGTA